MFTEGRGTSNLIRPAILNQQFLTAEVLARYLEPFPTPSSRTAMVKFFEMNPYMDDPKTPQASLDYFDDIDAKRVALLNKALLLIRADPGFVISEMTFHRFRTFASVLPGFEIRTFGPGLHFLQEENPTKLVKLISDWAWAHGLTLRHDAKSTQSH